MANTPSSKKRARQAVVKRAHNMSLRSTARTSIKKIHQAIADNSYTKAMESFRKTASILDTLQGKGIYNKNTVARYKSRLNAKIKKIAS